MGLAHRRADRPTTLPKGEGCRPVLLLIEVGRTVIPSLADHPTTVASPRPRRPMRAPLPRRGFQSRACRSLQPRRGHHRLSPRDGALSGKTHGLARLPGAWQAARDPAAAASRLTSPRGGLLAEKNFSRYHHISTRMPCSKQARKTEPNQYDDRGQAPQPLASRIAKR